MAAELPDQPQPAIPALDELMRLREKTTQGEWKSEIEPPGCSVSTWIQTAKFDLASFIEGGTIEDANFCAASHNLLPALAQQVAEQVLRLQAENERLRGMIERGNEQYKALLRLNKTL